ncbi:serine hydrolase [Paenibacillus elgii]
MNKFRVLRTKMISAIACTVLVSSLSVVPAPYTAAAEACCTSGPEDPKEVEQFADRFFERPEVRDRMAGASLVVVKGDRIVLKKGYGYADVERKIPVDPDRSVFRVASTSKVIAATAVMQLAEQGKIDLNQDMNTYMGEIPIPNKTGAPLTMKHLLTNATGFDYGDRAESTTPDLNRFVPLKDYIQANAPTVIRKPGESYRYDNLGFTIQGYVVERMSGKPFSTYVQEHIFAPLGMKNSHFRLTPDMQANLAVPYDTIGRPIPAYATVPTDSPGGGMLSTGADMGRFMLAHLNGGQLGDARILKEETVRTMQQPQLAIHPKLPNMAYGFEYGNRRLHNGRYVVEKGGDLDGYRTGMWLLPKEKVGLFITVNNNLDLRNQLLEAFMNHYYPQAKEPLSPQYPSAKAETLAKFEGTYSDLRNRMWTSRIRSVEGKLIMKAPLGEHVLTQVEPLLFEDEKGIRAAFKLNELGAVTAMYYDSKGDSWSEKLDEPERYSDVGAHDPYATYIYHLRQLGVLQGEPGKRFDPLQPILREEFIGWLIRWTGFAPSNQKPVFTDIGDSPFVKEIQAAYELGLIQGTAEAKFQPDKELTRGEAATIVWKLAFGYLHASPKEALLNDQPDDWAVEGIRFVVAKGLYGAETVKQANGSVDYQSRQPMKKQEAAALLSLFADHLF